ARVLCQRFDVSPAQVERDVLAILAKFHEQGLFDST
ncbi:MAG: PqqD family protein, partial [Planctomycetes bacterium]|nr:PqqD family protein [Planctomycetota bacterium]